MLGLTPLALGPMGLGGGGGPAVLSASAISPTVVRLVFSEDMTIDAALLAPATYTINEDPGSAAVTVLSVATEGTPPTNVVQLTLSGPLSPGQINYEVVVDLTVSDLLGNFLDPDADSAIFGGQATAVVADWPAYASSWTLAQFVGRPQFLAQLRAILTQHQEIEQALADLDQLRDLETAAGVHLDAVGVMLDLQRPAGLDDATYRLGLRGKAAVNNLQQGAPDELILALQSMLGAVGHRLELTYPMSARFLVDDPITYALGGMIADVLGVGYPATVNGALVYDPDGLSVVTFDDDTSGRPAGGWAEEGGGGTYDDVLTEEDAGD